MTSELWHSQYQLTQKTHKYMFCNKCALVYVFSEVLQCAVMPWPENTAQKWHEQHVPTVAGGGHGSDRSVVAEARWQ